MITRIRNELYLVLVPLLFAFNLIGFSEPLTLNSSIVEYDYKDVSSNKLLLHSVLIEYNYEDITSLALYRLVLDWLFRTSGRK